MNETLFPEIIGQEAAKKKISFHLENFDKTGILPPTALVAPRGQGKTTMGRSLARRLLKDQKPKTYYEVNCSVIENLPHFWEKFVLPKMAEKDVTILLDEASELPNDVSMALLTILNPNPENKTTFAVEDHTVEFDLRRISWLFATSEPHKINHALMDRFERIDLEDYSLPQLAGVVEKCLEGIKIKDDVLLHVASTLRGNARAAVKWGGNIHRRLLTREKNTFDKGDWLELMQDLSVLPLGMTPIEMKVLRILKENGESSLTNLSAKTQMTREALQKDVELYLMRHNLLEVRTKGRAITAKGLQYLKDYDEGKLL
jgi:Holliday junction resolvasome RuvABC ATP-dependent DNA helicase subunit